MGRDIIERTNEILKLDENKIVSKWNNAATPDEFDNIFVRENGSLIAAKNEDDYTWHGEGYYVLNSDFSLGDKVGYTSW